MAFLAHGRINGCCCCLSLRTGTYILAALIALSLLEELVYFNPIRMLIAFMSLSFFYMMVTDDTERNRQYFFFCFCLWLLFHVVYYTIYGVREINDSIMILEGYERLQDEDDDEEEEQDGQEEILEIEDIETELSEEEYDSSSEDENEE